MKDKLYLFQGKRVFAKNKEDVLRKVGLSPYDPKNKAKVVKVKQI